MPDGEGMGASAVESALAGAEELVAEEVVAEDEEALTVAEEVVTCSSPSDGRGPSRRVRHGHLG
jgi:hypothetical protein